MSWFRLDDQGAFHAKVLAAGNEAYGAWCRAGQWSSAHGTDGEIPKHVAAQIAPPRIWARLVSVKLLDQNPIKNDSFLIHDFLDYNPSRESIEERRRVRAANGSLGGKRRVLNNSAKQTLEQLQSNGSSDTQAVAEPLVDPCSNPRPVPSRPDPKKIPPTPQEKDVEQPHHDDPNLEAIRLKLHGMAPPLCFLAAIGAEVRLYNSVLNGVLTTAQIVNALDEAAMSLDADLYKVRKDDEDDIKRLEKFVQGCMKRARRDKDKPIPRQRAKISLPEAMNVLDKFREMYVTVGRYTTRYAEGPDDAQTAGEVHIECQKHGDPQKVVPAVIEAFLREEFYAKQGHSLASLLRTLRAEPARLLGQRKQVNGHESGMSEQFRKQALEGLADLKEIHSRQ